MSNRAGMPASYDEDISREPETWETCPDCEGTGQSWSEIYDDWASCRGCGGTGESAAKS